MTSAKNGFEQVPVSSGAPANEAVTGGPLNAGGSSTTVPEMVDTLDVPDDTCVDSVVCVLLRPPPPPLPTEVKFNGEQPTKAGAVRLTLEHSSWLN